MATKLFNVRLGPHDRQILTQLANRDQMTPSDVVRKLIRAANPAERAPANHPQDGALSLPRP